MSSVVLVEEGTGRDGQKGERRHGKGDARVWGGRHVKVEGGTGRDGSDGQKGERREGRKGDGKEEPKKNERGATGGRYKMGRKGREGDRWEWLLK